MSSSKITSVAIIPARGGSKRIPGKNIKPFLGKPMISYSIGAARESGVFDRIIVTTDSQEIAEIAKEYGAEVPFIRPPELSDDHTDTDAVLLHAMAGSTVTGHRLTIFAAYIRLLLLSDPNI